MVLFNEEIVALLNECFIKNEEHIESVLLATYGINIQFANLKVQCNERVFATFSGQMYEWNDAPNSGPWGRLVRQLAKGAFLKRPDLLTISFASGDFLDIETAENDTESVIFSFPPKDECFVMEVF